MLYNIQFLRPLFQSSSSSSNDDLNYYIRLISNDLIHDDQYVCENQHSNKLELKRQLKWLSANSQPTPFQEKRSYHRFQFIAMRQYIYNNPTEKKIHEILNKNREVVIRINENPNSSKISSTVGISIKGGMEFSLPIIISRIRSSIQAENDIYIGDEIIEINGKRLRKAMHFDVHSALRKHIDERIKEGRNEISLTLRYSNTSMLLANDIRHLLVNGVKNEEIVIDTQSNTLKQFIYWESVEKLSFQHFHFSRVSSSDGNTISINHLKPSIPNMNNPKNRNHIKFELFSSTYPLFHRIFNFSSNSPFLNCIIKPIDYPTSSLLMNLQRTIDNSKKDFIQKENEKLFIDQQIHFLTWIQLFPDIDNCSLMKNSKNRTNIENRNDVHNNNKNHSSTTTTTTSTTTSVLQNEITESDLGYDSMKDNTAISSSPSIKSNTSPLNMSGGNDNFTDKEHEKHKISFPSYKFDIRIEKKQKRTNFSERFLYQNLRSTKFHLSSTFRSVNMKYLSDVDDSTSGTYQNKLSVPIDGKLKKPSNIFLLAIKGFELFLFHENSTPNNTSEWLLSSFTKMSLLTSTISVIDSETNGKMIHLQSLDNEIYFNFSNFHFDVEHFMKDFLRHYFHITELSICNVHHLNYGCYIKEMENDEMIICERSNVNGKFSRFKKNLNKKLHQRKTCAVEDSNDYRKFISHSNYSQFNYMSGTLSDSVRKIQHDVMAQSTIIPNVRYQNITLCRWQISFRNGLQFFTNTPNSLRKSSSFRKILSIKWNEFRCLKRKEPNEMFIDYEKKSLYDNQLTDIQTVHLIIDENLLKETETLINNIQLIRLLFIYTDISTFIYEDKLTINDIYTLSFSYENKGKYSKNNSIKSNNPSDPLSTSCHQRPLITSNSLHSYQLEDISSLHSNSLMKTSCTQRPLITSSSNASPIRLLDKERLDGMRLRRTDRIYQNRFNTTNVILPSCTEPVMNN
ncbi:hypothetical protein SNEBB_000185 [Seison nebaliae]|nr:hypothetical protein SNEBB_000185 [Seison nebaliae]